MIVKPIRTDEEHAAALRRIEELWDAPEGSAEADELEVLAILAERYEEEQWPVEAPDPADVLRYIMDQRSLTAGDLEKYIGHRGHVYEILNGKRRLSLAMIWRLHEGLNIPTDLLIKPVPSLAEAGENDHARA
jgi:HTH-type transcriptional regulator / antitoxin HigA